MLGHKFLEDLVSLAALLPIQCKSEVFPMRERSIRHTREKVTEADILNLVPNTYRVCRCVSNHLRDLESSRSHPMTQKDSVRLDTTVILQVGFES